jgi:23S rRNA (adenine2503-C2)-methyltransferase
MIKEFKTRTGAIFCDTEKKMEYLYVGDYGKENNIKADFLGFKKEINQVSHRKVDLKDKMVVTISTQKGCPMNCMFCDCPKVKFGGNISREELAEEVVNAIKFSKCEYTERFNLHLARMGEPSLNAANVLNFLKYDLRDIVNANMKADVIHPVFTTMMPKSLGVEGMGQILDAFCQIKNEDYDGEAGLQLSINSTDEKQRKELFRGLSMSLEDIASVARNLPKPKGRKYTLNFPVTDKTILDPKELSRLFDKDKFIVKITPIHETNEANANGINTPEGYYKYDVYRQFEQPLLDEGWEVIVFIPSKEEDEDRITCGNALLSTYNKH